MYESPISIMHRRIEQNTKDAVENVVYNVVLEVSVGVDKGELIKALAYDRDQYNRGYADGKADGSPKWISVKEELPVKQCRVIVRTGHNMVTAGWRSYHVDVKGGELWEVDGAHNYRNDVTHWMPLPEPKENE